MKKRLIPKFINYILKKYTKQIYELNKLTGGIFSDNFLCVSNFSNSWNKSLKSQYFCSFKDKPIYEFLADNLENRQNFNKIHKMVEFINERYMIENNTSFKIIYLFLNKNLDTFLFEYKESFEFRMDLNSSEKKFRNSKKFKQHSLEVQEELVKIFRENYNTKSIRLWK
jgi:hypothetical protein